MNAADDVVFLPDVDKPLLDNDRVQADPGRRHPARHCVMVDDKLGIATAMKKILQDRLAIVFSRQGHYALDPHNLSADPPADPATAGIGDLLDCDLPALLMPARTVDRSPETT